ncbi:cytoskeleton protein RodZ [Desulfovibrionales bacterium]
MSLQEVGEILRHERLRQGLSVDEVMRTTKIGRRSLEALEEGVSADLPHLVYVKGFIAAYAAVLGLDSRELTRLASAFCSDETLSGLGRLDEAVNSLTTTCVSSGSVKTKKGGREVEIWIIAVAACLVMASVSALVWFFVGPIAQRFSRPRVEQLGKGPVRIASPSDRIVLPQPSAIEEQTAGTRQPVAHLGHNKTNIMSLARLDVANKVELQKLETREEIKHESKIVSQLEPKVESKLAAVTSAQSFSVEPSKVGIPLPAIGSTEVDYEAIKLMAQTPKREPAMDIAQEEALIARPSSSAIFQAVAEDSLPPLPVDPGEANGHHLLELHAVETGWVETIVDSVVRRDFYLQVGQQASVKFTKTLKVWLRNAGGVKLVFDGKHYPIRYASGSAKELTFPPKNKSRSEG